MSSVQIAFGLRWWVKAAVFVGWLVYYSLPLAAWRNAFGGWLAVMAKRSVR